MIPDPKCVNCNFICKGCRDPVEPRIVWALENKQGEYLEYVFGTMKMIRWVKTLEEAQCYISKGSVEMDKSYVNKYFKEFKPKAFQYILQGSGSDNND